MLHKLIKKLRSYFGTGIIIFLPLAITFYMIRWIINYVDRLFNDIVPIATVPGVGILVTIVVITFVGFLVNNLVGKFLLNKWEAIVDRIPLARVIYSSSKQILTSFVGNKDGKKFNTPVMVEFPRKGVMSYGFITKDNARHSLVDKDADNYYTVYIPTAPNPTTGFVILVKKDDVYLLNESSEAVLQGILSMGLSFRHSTTKSKVTLSEITKSAQSSLGKVKKTSRGRAKT